jgi:hypothetical protein
MGLLDEAIREHLELKRRRGADPHELAREEQEALEPLDLDGELPAWVQWPAAPEVLDASGSPMPGEGAPEAIDQETVEVDMDALFSQTDAPAGQSVSVPAGPITARRITPVPAGPPPAEEFEWEVPNRPPPASGAPDPAAQESVAFE